MEHDAILAALRCIIRDVLDDEHLALTAATTADEVEGWDSMAHISIVVAAEQHFHVKFGTAEIETLRDVGDFVALIAKKGGHP